MGIVKAVSTPNISKKGRNIMKYYVVSDVHGYLTPLKRALNEKGFFEEKEPHKLIICGDLLDRGGESKELIDFVLQLINEDKVILIKGNHEDLFEILMEDLKSNENSLLRIAMGESYHIKNGTWQTALELTGLTNERALATPILASNLMKNSVYYKKIIKNMVDYYETENYIFTHGYIPCKSDIGNNGYATFKKFSFNKNWRDESKENWEYARWYNGIEFVCEKNLGVYDKTVVCGHWETSYGHRLKNPNMNIQELKRKYEPFQDKGIIALDSTTIESGIVNCIIIED